MIKRTIDISKSSYLHLKNSQLLIDQNGQTAGKIPVEDLGILILEHPAITITQGALLECQKNKVAVVFCDERHLPYSTMLPIAEGNQLHSKVLRHQVQLSQPAKKRLWKNIVREKIKQQALTLENVGKPYNEFRMLADKVKSGDSENIEAEAARKYWPLLMGQDFRRDYQAEGANALLNYGYSILRAIIARALVGTGLHPALGLFHHNQYDGLALADDMMEPFRPWVDSMVYNILQDNPEAQVNRASKQVLLELPAKQVIWEKKKLPFLVVSHLLAARLKLAHQDTAVSMFWPEWLE